MSHGFAMVCEKDIKVFWVRKNVPFCARIENFVYDQSINIWMAILKALQGNLDFEPKA